MCSKTLILQLHVLLLIVWHFLYSICWVPFFIKLWLQEHNHIFCIYKESSSTYFSSYCHLCQTTNMIYFTLSMSSNIINAYNLYFILVWKFLDVVQTYIVKNSCHSQLHCGYQVQGAWIPGTCIFKHLLNTIFTKLWSCFRSSEKHE